MKSPFLPQEIAGEKAINPKMVKEVSVNEGPPAAFAQNFCVNCHGDHGQGGKIGPPLVGITSKPNRSKDDLLKLLDDTRAYGLKDPMPGSFPKLSAEDKVKIVEWLDGLRSSR